MARPEWKGPYVFAKKTIKQIQELKKNHTALKVSRNAEIFPKFLGLDVKVHNGKKYTEITVSEEMIGHKFGEFSFTRSKFSFKKKRSKK